MAGEGSMKAMNDSIKANRKLRRKKSFFSRERSYQNIKVEYLRASKGHKNIKTATKEELAQIRKKITWERRKKIIFVFSVLLTTLILISCLLHQTIKKNELANAKIEQKLLEDKIDQTSFYINDGDKQLAKGNFHNAIFQYNKALKILPKDYDLQYRVAYAYVYQCRNTKKDCDTAQKKVSTLLKYFPDKSELLTLANELN